MHSPIRFFAATIFLCFFVDSTFADVLCKTKSSSLVTRLKKCKKGERRFDLAKVGVVDPSQAIFGDGSAGALDITTDVDDFDSTTDGNFQYSSFRIRQGASLTTRSGRVYRVSGSCVIEGSLASANNPGRGGFASVSNNTFFSYQTGASGSGTAGANGVCVNNNSAIAAGAPSVSGLSLPEAVNLTVPRIVDAPAGAGAINSGGGSGGGTIGLFCKEGITVTSTGIIDVEGDDGQNSGGGGGAGGLLLLASNGSIVNSGTLQALGGDGGSSSSNTGSGGGGSGGIIHLIAPTISAGNTNVIGGAAGSDATPVSSAVRCGGSGGGAFIGSGGAGSSVPAGASSTASGATAGEDGVVISTRTEPLAILNR